MRDSWMIALVGLVGACNGAPSNESGTGEETDTSAGTGTDGTTDETTDETTDDSTETGEDPQNPEVCNPVINDCVEDLDSKCVLVENEAFCDAPHGDDQLSEVCTRPIDEPGDDTCAGTLFCSGYRYPRAANPADQVRGCHAFCQEGDCPADEMCGALFPSAYGLCLDRCEPFVDACGPDPSNVCGPRARLAGDLAFACVWAGPLASQSECSGDDVCGEDHTCRNTTGGVTGHCQPLCDNAHPCVDAALCWPFDSEELTAYGTCSLSDLSCVGSVVWPGPVNAEELVEVEVAWMDQYFAGATVKACAAADSDCASPLDQQQSGVDGIASVTVPTLGVGFDGYFEISAPNLRTTLVYPSRPMTGVRAAVHVELFGADALEATVLGFGGSDPARGSLISWGRDCAGDIVGGTSFDISTADIATVIAPTRHSFFAGFGNPSPTYAADSADPALAMGSGVIALDVPPGLATITVSAAGQTLATRDVIVRAGTITKLLHEPMP